MFMASHGMRDMGEGHEKVANPVEVAELKETGRQIMLWSLVTSGAMTAMAVAAFALR
jgi:hypothetical protein